MERGCANKEIKRHIVSVSSALYTALTDWPLLHLHLGNMVIEHTNLVLILFNLDHVENFFFLYGLKQHVLVNYLLKSL